MSHKLRRNNILSGIRSVLAGGQPVLDVSILENALDFRAVIDNLEQIISIKNEQGRYVFANKIFCDLLRLQQEEIIAKDDSELGFFLNPELIVRSDTEVFITGKSKHNAAENITDFFGIKFLFKTDRIPLKENWSNLIYNFVN